MNNSWDDSAQVRRELYLLYSSNHHLLTSILKNACYPSCFQQYSCLVKTHLVEMHQRRKDYTWSILELYLLLFLLFAAGFMRLLSSMELSHMVALNSLTLTSKPSTIAKKNLKYNNSYKESESKIITIITVFFPSKQVNYGAQLKVKKPSQNHEQIFETDIQLDIKSL